MFSEVILSISEHCVSCCLVAAADEEEFNQGIILPPLIIQLKKILDQYPDDTQILKVSTSTLVLFPASLCSQSHECGSLPNATKPMRIFQFVLMTFNIVGQQWQRLCNQAVY